MALSPAVSRALVLAVLVLSLAAGVGAAYFRFNELSAEAVGVYAPYLKQAGLPALFLVLYFMVSEGLVALTFAITGLIVAWRGGSNIATFGAVALMMYGVTLPPPMHAVIVVVPPLPMWLVLERSLGVGFFVVFLLLFPGGRAALPTRIACGAMFVWTALWPFVPSINPYTFPRPFPFLVMATLFGGGAAVQLMAFRHSSAAAQQQTKWVVYALVASVSGDLLTHLPWELTDLHHGPDLPILLLHQPFFISSQLAVPIAIAFSILYFGLWEIDFVVSRTLIYGAITTFAGIMWEIVNLISTKLITGKMGEQSAGAGPAMATIITGFVLKPVYEKIKKYIDKRFAPPTLDLTEDFPELEPAYIARIPLDRMLDTVMDRLPPLFAVKQAAVWFYDDEGKLVLQNSRVLAELDANAQLPSEEALESLRKGEVVRAGEPSERVYVPLALPRKAPDLLGILLLGEREDDKGYSQLEVSALRDLGRKLGTAVAVARLESQPPSLPLLGAG